MEKEVKPYYEDDYQSLDEMSTIDLLENEGRGSRRIKRARTYYSSNQSNLRQSNKWRAT